VLAVVRQVDGRHPAAADLPVYGVALRQRCPNGFEPFGNRGAAARGAALI
jgi:hypothetical protein